MWMIYLNGLALLFLKSKLHYYVTQLFVAKRDFYTLVF